MNITHHETLGSNIGIFIQCSYTDAPGVLIERPKVAISSLCGSAGDCDKCLWHCKVSLESFNRSIRWSGLVHASSSYGRTRLFILRLYHLAVHLLCQSQIRRLIRKSGLCSELHWCWLSLSCDVGVCRFRFISVPLIDFMFSGHRSLYLSHCSRCDNTSDNYISNY